MTPIDSNYMEQAIGPNGRLSRLECDLGNLKHGDVKDLKLRVEALEESGPKAIPMQAADISRLEREVAVLKERELQRLMDEDHYRRDTLATSNKMLRRIQQLEAERGKATIPSVYTAVRRDSITTLLENGDILAGNLRAQLPSEQIPGYQTPWSQARKMLENNDLYVIWFAWASIMRFRDSLSEGWDA